MYFAWNDNQDRAILFPKVSILNRAQMNNNGARLNNHQLPTAANNRDRAQHMSERKDS
jgi:hypothetical protein